MTAQVVASLLVAAALVTAPGPAGPRSRLPGARDAGGKPGEDRSARWLRFRADSSDQPLELAGAWELLAACLRAGMPVAVALRAIAERLDAPAGPALRRSAQLLALGADPTQAWQPALECHATARLARSARRSGRGGGALAESLARLAAELRADAREQSEARAQRAGVLIAAPLGLCFLPAFPRYRGGAGADRTGQRPDVAMVINNERSPLMIKILRRWRHVVSGEDGMSTVEYAIGTVAAAAFAAVLYKVVTE